MFKYPLRRLRWRFFRVTFRLRRHPRLQHFGLAMREPGLWRFDRHSVSGAVGLGLFSALLPVPFQMLIGASLAIAVRVNMPLTLAMVWITNPLTMGPIFYATYELGQWLLDAEQAVIQPDMGNVSLFAWINMVWKPLLLGSLVAAIATSLLAYLLVSFGWSLIAASGSRKP